MVRTTFKAMHLAASLMASLFVVPHAFAEYKRGASDPVWIDQTAKVPFSQKPLHGQIDGIEFEPTSAESVFQRTSANGGGGYKVTFRDSGGRQIDVTLNGIAKFENANFTQTASVKLKGATGLSVDNSLHAVPLNEYGIRIALGKIAPTKTQPIYIVFREDKNNWMEGYIYAIVHERELF